MKCDMIFPFGIKLSSKHSNFLGSFQREISEFKNKPRKDTLIESAKILHGVINSFFHICNLNGVNQRITVGVNTFGFEVLN